jgi:16S rRNA (uracil1498-N3)-methyltransferase
MRKFTSKENFQLGERVSLSPEESNHALRVLRMQEGDSAILLNGQGKLGYGKISAIQEGIVWLTIEKIDNVEARTPIFLLQAILKGPKMDWLLEKATELGVNGIQPMITARTIAKSEKIDRWQRIISAAMKQSGNPVEPKLYPTLSLSAALDQHPNGLKVFLQPDSAAGLAQVIANHPSQAVVLAIGPEGGFTPEEENLFEKSGFLRAGLSLQVLRGETAAIAALSIAAHSIDFSAPKRV